MSTTGEVVQDKESDIEKFGDKKVSIGPDGVPYTIYSHPMEALNSLKAPVYKLRYMAVQNMLEQYSQSHNLQSVVEYGCADLKFVEFLMKSNDIYFEQLFLIDIKKNKLLECKHKAEPKLRHYFYKSERPLSVEIIVGSIGRPYEKLKEIDTVVAIEVIEHLFPNSFSAMEYNIFAYMQPKVVILTTPNSDYNVLFDNFKGVRDPDHKFEWSREQYQDWGLNIIKRFPNYQVNFDGIGAGNKDIAKYGCVTQMAIFERISDKLTYDEKESFGICCSCAIFPDDKPFEVLDNIQFPFVKREDFILEKIFAYIQSYLNDDCSYYDCITEILNVPLEVLVSSFNNDNFEYRSKTICITEKEVKNVLQNAKYDVQEMKIDDKSQYHLVFRNTAQSDNDTEDS